MLASEPVLSFVSQKQTSGPEFTLSNSGNNIRDTIATLAAEASATFTVVARVNAAASPKTVLSNKARISSDDAIDSVPMDDAAMVRTCVHSGASAVGTV